MNSKPECFSVGNELKMPTLSQFLVYGIDPSIATLGSRGYFFLMDTDGSRRSRVNEARLHYR